MKTQSTSDDSGQLIAEIERYLQAVELFRSLSCEPKWRAESLAHAGFET